MNSDKTTTEEDVIKYCYDQGVTVKEHRTVSRDEDKTVWWYLYETVVEGPFSTLGAACWNCAERFGWVNKAAGWSRKNKQLGD